MKRIAALEPTKEERQIITQARLILDDPDGRLSSVPTLSRNAFWPYEEPSYIDRTLGEMLQKTSDTPDIEREFWDEIMAITEAVRTSGLDPDLANLEKELETSPSTAMWKGLNLRATALLIWDQFAHSVRYKDGYVYKIISPTDVVATPPTILRSNVAQYISDAAVAYAHAKANAEHQAFILKKYRSWIFILSYVCLFLLAILFGLLTKS